MQTASMGQSGDAGALVPEPTRPGAGEVLIRVPAPPRLPRLPRLRGVDLARSLAVLGMFAVHVAMPDSSVALTDPGSWPGVVHGRSSILFATLAGVSLALMTGRTSPPTGQALVTARMRVLVRCVCLFAAGGLVQLVSTNVAVILEYYAVVLALCIPFLAWRTRRLLLLAAVLAVVMPTLRLLVATSSMGSTGWSSWVGGGGELGMLAVNGTYPALVWWAFAVAGLAVGRADLGATRVRRALVVGGTALAVLGYGGSWVATQVWPAVNPWSAAASSGVDGSGGSGSLGSGSVGSGSGSGSAVVDAAPTYLSGGDPLIAGYGCYEFGDGTAWCAAPGTPGAPTPEGVDEEYPEPTDDGPAWGEYLTVDQFLGAQPHSGTTFEVLGSGGVALAVLGVCLVVADAARRARRGGWVLAPLVAVGSMPLTAYAAHIVGLAVTQHLAGAYDGDGTGGSGWLSGGWPLWCVFAAAVLVGCTLWARFLGRGPLERAISWTVARSMRP